MLNTKTYSIGKLSQILKVSIGTLRRWEKEGKIKSTRTTGGHRRYMIQENLPTSIQNSSTISETAKKLNISTSTLRRWEKEGKISSTRTLGGHRRYSLGKTKPWIKNAHRREHLIDPIMNITPKPREFVNKYAISSALFGITIYIAISFVHTLNPVQRIRSLTMSRIPYLKIITDSYTDSYIPAPLAQVLAAQTGIPTFNINITSSFNDVADFVKGLNSSDITTAGLTATGAANLANLNVSGNATLSNLTISGNASVGDLININNVGYSFPTTQGSASTYLKNNGSGTLTWASVSTPSNLSDLSGVLGISAGGTNNSTAYTSGSVIFSNGTKLTENNSSLFWDTTNNRLGIGNKSPTATLSVGSSSQFQVSSTGIVNLSPNVSTGTGTSAGLYLAANSLTTGNGIDFQTNSLTTGNLLNLTTTSTAGNGEKVLNISASGANGTGSATNYGLYSNITNTGTSSTNVAGYFSATGGTNNYGLVIANGNVGIGTTTPTSSLTINSGSINWNTSNNAEAIDLGGTYLVSRSNQIDGGGMSNNYISFGDTNYNSSFLNLSGNNGIILERNSGTILGIGTTSGSAHFDSNSILTLPTDGLILGTNELVTSGGNVGIGTASPGNLLDVSSSSTSTASAMIRNTSTNAGIAGLGIQLNSTTLGNTSRFVNFIDKNGTIIGKIQAANTTSVNYATNGVDFAEWFTKDGNGDFSPGTVVSAGSLQQSVLASNTPYDNKIVGIISEYPGFTGGTEGPDKVKIALVGQVPVKIDPSSPAINPGDTLTSSNTPGMATKATQPGAIVAKALQSWDHDGEKIQAYVNIGYYNTPVASASSDLGSLVVLGNSVLTDTVINGKLNVGSLTVNNTDQSVNAIGVLKIQNLSLGNIDFMNGLITFDTQGNITAKSITAGKYKVAGTSAGVDKIVSGQTSTTISTNEVRNNSLIFITPQTQTDKTLSVTAKSEGSNFKVEISSPDSKDINFDWWIVDRQ